MTQMMPCALEIAGDGSIGDASLDWDRCLAVQWRGGRARSRWRVLPIARAIR
jgi:hypothetical protein